MRYELAKKLKDSGFPQIARHGDLLCNCSGDWKKHQQHADNPPLVYAPTLDELIEAIGDNFKLEFSLDVWLATKLYVENTTGLTAKEAVANLWLALNTK